MAKILEKIHLSFIARITVAFQWEDGEPWTHGVIVKPNNDDYRGHSYII